MGVNEIISLLTHVNGLGGVMNLVDLALFFGGFIGSFILGTEWRKERFNQEKDRLMNRIERLERDLDSVRIKNMNDYFETKRPGVRD